MSRAAALGERPFRRTYEAVLTAQSAPFATPARWACHHHAGHSEIEAYVPVIGRLEVIAEAHAIEGVNARANAELIVQAVNEHARLSPLILEMAALLMQCAERGKLPDDLTREAEFLRIRASRVAG